MRIERKNIEINNIETKNIEKKNGKRIRNMIAIFVVMCAMFMVPTSGAKAATKQYGILIADKDGTYTFYDLNLAAGNQAIEMSDNGKVMVPLKKVCSYFENLTYSFNFTTRKATVVNNRTGKRLVLEENKKYAYLYAKGAKTGTKISLTEKSYVSKDSNAMMVHMAALKSIFYKTSGYQYYGKKAIKEAGYDSSLYQGIIVYNQYKKVSKLPSPTKVNYVAEQIASNVVKVTIPEGYSVAQTVNRLVKSGVCISSQAVYQAMEEVDFSKYSMFDGREVDETICFPLEGYLYPDTYEFYKNTEPEQVIAKILKNSNNKLSSYQEAASELGYSLDDILNIASIIEKETGVDAEMPKVSSVLHARLQKGWKIQCDATIHYVEKYIKPYISGDVNRYNEYYNTYKCEALPAGPICNPGKKAIEAALNPSQEVYLYFATDDAGNYYYAANDDEWKIMKETIQLKNAELAAESEK